MSFNKLKFVELTLITTLIIYGREDICNSYLAIRKYGLEPAYVFIKFSDRYPAVLAFMILEQFYWRKPIAFHSIALDIVVLLFFIMLLVFIML